ncbi:hypothetical protein ACVIWU_006434 [Bradyrhizobium sp. USDA 4509]
MLTALILLVIWLLINVLFFVAMTPVSKSDRNAQRTRERIWHIFRR